MHLGYMRIVSMKIRRITEFLDKNEAVQYCTVIFQYTCVGRLITQIQFWDSLQKRILCAST